MCVIGLEVEYIVEGFSTLAQMAAQPSVIVSYIETISFMVLFHLD
jgi:hypothetical protein